MESKDDVNYVKALTRLVVEGMATNDRTKNTWQNTMSAGMRLLKVDPTLRRPRPKEMEGHRTAAQSQQQGPLGEGKPSSNRDRNS